VSYGYYRAFNTMLDHVQVLYNMAVSAAKGNRFKELRKGIQSHYCKIHVYVYFIYFKIILLQCRKLFVFLFPVFLKLFLNELQNNFGIEMINCISVKIWYTTLSQGCIY